jgi:hypothetical protein
VPSLLLLLLQEVRVDEILGVEEAANISGILHDLMFTIPLVH